MPIYLRTFYYKQLAEQKEEERKQMDKANKNIKRPNIRK